MAKTYIKDLNKMGRWRKTFILKHGNKLPTLKKNTPKKKFNIAEYLGDVDKYIVGKPKIVKIK